MKNIHIDGKEYELDIDRAKELKILKEKYVLKETLEAGDVFIDPRPHRTNPLVLVKAIWSNERYDKAWVLLGMRGGHSPNSNDFYRELHTLEACRDHIIEEGMVFSYSDHQRKLNPNKL